MVMLSVAVLLCVIAARATAAPVLAFSLATPDRPVSADDLAVQILLRNIGDQPIVLLRDPRGPLAPLETNVFDIVKIDGQVPVFTGAALRYNPEAALAAKVTSEWLTLAPGQSFSAEHGKSFLGPYLAGVYNFTLSGPGIYSISLRFNHFIYETPRGTLDSLAARLDTTNSITIEGALASLKLLEKVSRSHLSLKRATITGCNSTQEGAINGATTAGQALVSSALSDLNATSTGSTRYVRWFGTWTSSRFNKVKTGFGNLNNKFSTWTYNCNCTDTGSYAYVYPATYGRVYLCPLFFTANATGPNSRADTLVHEGSHFVSVAGTEDYVYGQNSSLELARANPDRAVMNADNYAYFSVNPSIPVLNEGILRGRIR